MTAEHDTQRRRPSRRRRIFRVCLLLALVLPLTYYVLAGIRWSIRIDRQMKTIRDAGLPTTLAELNTWYRLPDEAVENAANYYLDAFACYSAPNEEDANCLPWVGSGQLPRPGEPLPDPVRQAMARFVAANKQALDLLHEAASIPACRYPVDFRKGQGALLPWTGELRRSCFLLGCEAVLYAEDGQSSLACKSIEAGLGLGNSLAREPTLVSQLVRTSTRSIVLTGLSRVLTRTGLTDEHLRAIDLALACGDDPCGIRTGMVGDRVFGIDLMEHPSVDLSPMPMGEERGVTRAALAAYVALGLARRDQAEYLEVMAARFRVSGLPEPQQRAAGKAVDEQTARIPSSHILVRMFLPALSMCQELGLRSAAQTRAARTALAIERYRLKSGELPGTLSDLVPEYLSAVLLDPFTGQAIKYRSLAKGYVVYSVGSDLSDEGGRERQANRRHGEPMLPYDIPFVVER